MTERPRYLSVFLTFARNSLIRDMTFRGNFLLEVASSLIWVAMFLGLYALVFEYTDSIGAGSGWNKHQFFVFLATTMLINAVVQTFFMPNASELSELIRTGQLDFALLKPIDTQFLVSLAKLDWSSLADALAAGGLLAYALGKLGAEITLLQAGLYLLYVGCGVAIMYSLMIALASCSVWLGRNQSLYDFWFYITNFSRYPMEIFSGFYGAPLRLAFTFIVPVMIVVNVPARLLARPLAEQDWTLAAFALVATAGSLTASRWVFLRALASYRSASS